MTKEERIEAFNDKSELMEIIPDLRLRIKGSFMVELYNELIEPSFIDDYIKELAEAKEIMEIHNER